jgi:hypothetical protein
MSLMIDFGELSKHLVDAGTSLNFATASLYSCHTTQASSVAQFVKLRTEITSTACVYKQVVLPLARASVQKLKMLTEYLQQLGYKDALKVASEIADDCQKVAILMELNRDSHTEMAVEFKVAGALANDLLQGCQLDVQLFEESADEHRNTAATYNKWSFYLGLLPLVGYVISPILQGYASENRAEAVAATEHAKLAETAAHLIKGTLMISISTYCDAMTSFAIGFTWLASECDTLMQKGDHFEESKKEVFWQMLSAQVPLLNAAIAHFQAALVRAEIDLRSLPNSPKPNYVQQWLQKKITGNRMSFYDRCLTALTRKQIAAIMPCD